MKILYIASANASLLSDMRDKDDVEVLLLSVNHDKFSTQEMTHATEFCLRQVDRADAVVFEGIEKRPYAFDTQEFLAGYAYAKGKPVVVVGGYWTLGMHAPRVLTSEPETLGRVLAKIEKTLNNPEREIIGGIVINSGVVQGGNGMDFFTPEAEGAGGQPPTEAGDGSHI